MVLINRFELTQTARAQVWLPQAGKERRLIPRRQTPPPPLHRAVRGVDLIHYPKHVALLPVLAIAKACCKGQASRC